MIAAVWLFGATLVDIRLDFAVVALLDDWLCRVSFVCDWPSEVLPSWLCNVVWPGVVSWVGTVLPADWLREAALVDDWLPCPGESVCFLWKVLAGDWLVIGGLFPDKSWAAFVADWLTGTASDWLVWTMWFKGWLGVIVVLDWWGTLLLAEGWILGVPCLVGWWFDAVLLGLFVASVLAADWLGCTVLVGVLVDDGAEGDSLDVWTDDARLVCVVGVDGDWLVWAILPDDLPSDCNGGVGILCDWTVFVVE